MKFPPSVCDAWAIRLCGTYSNHKLKVQSFVSDLPTVKRSEFTYGWILLVLFFGAHTLPSGAKMGETGVSSGAPFWNRDHNACLLAMKFTWLLLLNTHWPSEPRTQHKPFTTNRALLMPRERSAGGPYVHPVPGVL